MLFCVISGYWIREWMTFVLLAPELTSVSSISHGYAVREYFYHSVMLRKLGPWSGSFLSQKWWSFQISVLRENPWQSLLLQQIRHVLLQHASHTCGVMKGNLTPVQTTLEALQVALWDVGHGVQRVRAHQCYEYKLFWQQALPPAWLLFTGQPLLVCTIL